MKLSKPDSQNIEVLEALEIDEDGLFLLLCRYFAYRGSRGSNVTGQFGFPPDKALQETIRWALRGHGQSPTELPKGSPRNPLGN